MELDRQLLYPAFYYAHTSDMPVSLTAWLCVKMYTSVEHDLCPTCYERPPVLSDRFWWAEGVVAQDRFYCMVNGKLDRTKMVNWTGQSGRMIFINILATPDEGKSLRRRMVKIIMGDTSEKHVQKRS